MKGILMNKNFLTIFCSIIAIIFISLCLTGCNKQLIDMNYSYNKAICNIGNETKEINIKKWNDYEGEQLQIIDDNGNTYLVSSLNCVLLKEK